MIRLDGLREVLGKLEAKSDAVDRKVGDVMRLAAERVMVDAKQNTPVDTSALRNSGRVSPAVRTGSGWEIELGFGGQAKAYAIAVHEHPGRYDPPSWAEGVSFNAGGPKYLENALTSNESEIRRMIVDGVRRGLAAR